MEDEDRSGRDKSVSSPPLTRTNSQASNSQQATGPGASQTQSQWGSNSQTYAGDPRRRLQGTQMQTQAQIEGYGSIIQPLPHSRPQGQNMSPEVSITSARSSNRRPGGPGRRNTSTHAPHRGQEFSVDDGEDEVTEGDVQTPRRPSLPKSKSIIGNRPTIMSGQSTVKRRPAAQAPSLAKVDSKSDDEDTGPQDPDPPRVDGSNTMSVEETTLTQEPEEFDNTATEEDAEDGGDEDDPNLSDAESFTLKDRQDAINVTHPFGIRIWKPALYKKDRSVQRNAEGDIHSTPGAILSSWLVFFNYAWTVLFGWWLSLISLIGTLLCLIFGVLTDGNFDYTRVLWGVTKYLFYPFGKYVKLISDESYADEDEGEGRSISEYEQWQSGDIEEGRLFFGPSQSWNRSLVGRRRNSADSTDETQSLLGRGGRSSGHRDGVAKPKRRMFGRGKWTFGRIIFFLVFYGVLTPFLFLVSAICWLLVFTIPMGRVTLLLFDHLRRHPLALEFHSDQTAGRSGDAPSSILLCTYRAVGSKYWKYTIDGTNIFLMNLLSIVAFTIFDYFVLKQAMAIENGLTNNGLLFTLALASIIPLAYFIGQAVASISAQSSMGVGATINAFFSTIVEVFLYCVALNEGKAALVEGSVIGSIFAGVLFLPGLSMCFGAIKRKTQRFNVKSAGVTSTMLLFAVIAAFSPTLFYQIYGSTELRCLDCLPPNQSDANCRRCYSSQMPAIRTHFYNNAVRPYTYFCAVLLFLSYAVGLFFTLHTHAAVIWNTEIDEKKTERALEHPTTIQQTHFEGRDTTPTPNPTGSRQSTRFDVRDTQLYRRILGQSLHQIGAPDSAAGLQAVTPVSPSHQHNPSVAHDTNPFSESNTPHLPPPKSNEASPVGSPVIPKARQGICVPGMSEEDSRVLQRQMIEIAAVTATTAAREATKSPQNVHRSASANLAAYLDGRSQTGMRRSSRADGDSASHQPLGDVASSLHGPTPSGALDTNLHDAGAGGHDAPNWSRTKSAVILLTATLAYAVIAEILVNTVDAVLENVDINEKFLGVTLFALVPNTTEFLNAISFAMNGNIALSMEIGSAYALQVCLLQIPALVAFSAIHGRFVEPNNVIYHTFTLIFPQWDMITVILCVFLLSYMYGEGKSNYFKGSILILSYFVVVVGFYFSSFENVTELIIYGGSPYESLSKLPGRKGGVGSFSQPGSSGGEL